VCSRSWYVCAASKCFHALTCSELGEEDTRYAKGRDTRSPADTQHLCDPLSLYIYAKKSTIHYKGLHWYDGAFGLRSVMTRNVCYDTHRQQVIRPP
jgi:hypothetical protein